MDFLVEVFISSSIFHDGDNFTFSSLRFDAIIVSAEVGYEKPDVKIFRAALGNSVN